MCASGSDIISHTHNPLFEEWLVKTKWVRLADGYPTFPCGHRFPEECDCQKSSHMQRTETPVYDASLPKQQEVGRLSPSP